MLLVKPSTEILAMTENPLQLIELAGRTCYKSEERITETSHLQFAEMILKRGHETVLEHASATVRFICDRGVSHEIVRHRIASYSQESTRYCDYEGGHAAFIIPEFLRGNIKEGVYRNIVDETVGTCSDPASQTWLIAMEEAARAYRECSSAGWRPEQARSVLPNSLKTEVVMTANFREWRHFFKLRTAPAAHLQMREVALPLLVEFQSRVPVIFDNL